MIFIVDDSADYRLLVRQVFTLFLPQYPVRFFEDGADFYHYVADSESERNEPKPQLIILDMDMPGLDGYQTLRRLKQQPNWNYIPVVMMTNQASHQQIRDCYAIGANSFLIKPTALEPLKQVMTKVGQYWYDLNQLPVRQTRPGSLQ